MTGIIINDSGNGRKILKNSKWSFLGKLTHSGKMQRTKRMKRFINEYKAKIDLIFGYFERWPHQSIFKGKKEEQNKKSLTFRLDNMESKCKAMLLAV